ncbi:hypothetical protein WL58_07230 [Burkholderia cepacia]|nr:hypothetical protein WL58_07230 [Burkholderia cepacia]
MPQIVKAEIEQEPIIRPARDRLAFVDVPLSSSSYGSLESAGYRIASDGKNRPSAVCSIGITMFRGDGTFVVQRLKDRNR